MYFCAGGIRLDYLPVNGDKHIGRLGVGYFHPIAIYNSMAEESHVLYTACHIHIYYGHNGVAPTYQTARPGD